MTTLIPKSKSNSNSNSNSNYNKIANVSATLVSVVYLLLFAILAVIYDKLISDRIVNMFHIHPLLDFAGPNKDVNGYENYRENIDKLQNSFRFWSIFAVFGIIIATNMGIYLNYLRGRQPMKALYTIAGFTCIIVVPMYLLCNKITFIKIFENSIGYLVAKTLYRKHGSFDKFISTLFTHKTFIANSEVKINYGFMFSLFRLDNFGAVLRNIGNKPDNADYNFHVNPAIMEEDLRYLLRAVVTKNTIGHLSWVYFAAVASTLISIQYASYIL
jgi:hypothetical protein